MLKEGPFYLGLMADRGRDQANSRTSTNKTKAKWQEYPPSNEKENSGSKMSAWVVKGAAEKTGILNIGKSDVNEKKSRDH
jgi:hypothetical protein